MATSGEFVAVYEMKRFVIDCFLAVGTSRTQSEIMAECVIGADTIGHHSHGVYRLGKYLQDIQKGHIYIHTTPKIEKETNATAWVNGQNTLGPIVGNFCVKLAIEKARDIGAAIVVANNSNNFGAASYYTKQALQEGMIGLAFCNSTALMLANRAKYCNTGTNPISVAAPGICDDYFLLDMATTVASGGHIEIQQKNSQYLPDGWAANAACIPETNADVALSTGRFLPLGSYEETGSYKGTGLSVMVDILCGVLGAAGYSNMVGTWNTNYFKQRANIGHCFIVINPRFFAPDFDYRMSELLSAIRQAEPLDPNKPVRVPGDKKRHVDEIVSEYGGLWYPNYVLEDLKQFSISFKIKHVSYIPKPEPVRLTSSEEFAAVMLEAEKRVSVAREIEVVDDEKSRTGILVENEVQKPISLIVEDPSDWLCPITNSKEQHESRSAMHKRPRECSLKNKELLISSTDADEIPIFVNLDEIMET